MGGSTYAEFSCQPNVFYHFDDVPSFRMPTVAPPAGSQVLCRSPESLWFVRQRSDGCQYKFAYDLAFTTPESWNLGVELPSWDMRANPPAWWPCDAQGELRTDSGYEPPRAPEPVQCETVEQVSMPWAPLEVGTRVRCDSATDLVYVRDWAGSCEGEVTLSLQAQITHSDGVAISSWVTSRPDWWPCDNDGQIMDGTVYRPL